MHEGDDSVRTWRRRARSRPDRLWRLRTHQGAKDNPLHSLIYFALYFALWVLTHLFQLTRLDFVLRETITFRYPAGANTVVKAQPKVNAMFVLSAPLQPDRTRGALRLSKTASPPTRASPPTPTTQPYEHSFFLDVK